MATNLSRSVSDRSVSRTNHLACACDWPCSYYYDLAGPSSGTSTSSTTIIDNDDMLRGPKRVRFACEKPIQTRYLCVNVCVCVSSGSSTQKYFVRRTQFRMVIMGARAHALGSAHPMPTNVTRDRTSQDRIPPDSYLRIIRMRIPTTRNQTNVHITTFELLSRPYSRCPGNANQINTTKVQCALLDVRILCYVYANGHFTPDGVTDYFHFRNNTVRYVIISRYELCICVQFSLESCLHVHYQRNRILL